MENIDALDLLPLLSGQRYTSSGKLMQLLTVGSDDDNFLEDLAPFHSRTSEEL